MANKDKEKKAGYLQSVALDFKLLGVGLELGTFGYRVQRSDHSDRAASARSVQERPRADILPVRPEQTRSIRDLLHDF